VSQWKPPVVALAAAIALACCDRTVTQPLEKAPAQPAADAAYVAPPSVSWTHQAGGLITVAGQAPSGARVRLATPRGEAVYGVADGAGRWSLALPVIAHPRILGLSATVGGRQVQSQGYLLLTPSGRTALLRAGAGAVRLDPQPQAAIGAFDFDQDGGAVVSGQAPAGAAVSVSLDGRQAVDGRADAAGHYSLSLPSPVPAGRHRLAITGQGFAAQAAVEIAPAAPLADGPFRSQATADGVRADWMTPGGGLQSTLILG
jgi:hypothetical protein